MNKNNGSLVMSPKDFARVSRSCDKGWRKLELLFNRLSKRYLERKSIEEIELNKRLESLNLLDFV